MKQPNESRGAVFFRCFAATIGLVGALFAIGFLLFRGSTAAPQITPPVSQNLPEAEKRLTVLVLGREDASSVPEICCLFGFLPDKGTIALCALPMETYWKAGGGEGTLRSAYLSGGESYLRQQLSLYLEIPIDRTLVIDQEGLQNMVLTCGELPYTLKEDLAGTVHGRRVSYPRGRYDLDARTLADLMLLPGETPARRSDRIAALLRALTELHLPGVLTESGGELFQNLVNNSRTDLAYLDYLDRQQAAQFLATREGNAASCVYIDGTVGHEAYYLSETTLTCIRGTLGEITSAPES